MKSINLKFGKEKSLNDHPNSSGFVEFLPSKIRMQVELALKSVNGQSTKHTFTDYYQIANVVQDAESGLENLGILKKNAVGAKFIAHSGGMVSSSYMFVRVGTTIHLERKSSGWHLIKIQTNNLYQKPPRNQFLLTDAQDARAIALLRQKYQIEKDAK